MQLHQKPENYFISLRASPPLLFVLITRVPSARCLPANCTVAKGEHEQTSASASLFDDSCATYA